MRREGKVRGKPTNASKASGRCGRPRCVFCHEHPVSKAMAKTKGRNKRPLWPPVDDEWALHAHSDRHIPAGHIIAVPSLASDVDYDNDDDDDAYNTQDASHTEAEVIGHDVDDTLRVHGSNVDDNSDFNDGSNKVDADDGVDEAHDVNYAGMHATVDYASVLLSLNDAAHDDAGRAILHSLDVDNNVHIAADVNHGVYAKMTIPANDVIIDDDCDAIHGGHAMMLHAVDDVTLDDSNNDDGDANHEGYAKMVHAVDGVTFDGDDDRANDQLILPAFMAGLVNVEWRGSRIEDNEEEASDVDSERSSLSTDWYHVAPSDPVDEWYLC